LGGKGEGGSRGGPPGDLYVVIHVAQHELFERRGDDLFCSVPVSYDAAALGGEVEVPTIEGFAKLKLAPGTENGKVFRLRGKGMPNVEGYGAGDLHVRVGVEVPTRLSSKQRKLLKEFSESREEENYSQARRFREMADSFYLRRDIVSKETEPS
jgi:molecular chaperone DnaJ